jgi:MPBQ/MSBQ methyltransferase
MRCNVSAIPVGPIKASISGRPFTSARPQAPRIAARPHGVAPVKPADADPRSLRLDAQAAPRDLSKLRLIQHKAEARVFYAFLSQVYDHIVNPGHWTVDMRTEALEPALLDSPDLKVADIGGGTGFCTLGVVATVAPANVTLVDQSPHQLAKARVKPDLAGVTIMEGDAEDLPLPTDAFDRYVSAGSIEYWPEPQRGICEAYRILKPGGLACMIGPVHPTHPLSRLMADLWMLFPTEEEYVTWFKAAGFEDVKIKRIGPTWYRGVRRHGLIMGCSVTGVKSAAGPSLLELGPKTEQSGTINTNPLMFLARTVLGSLAGFYYFVLPLYMWVKHLVWPRTGPLADLF